MFIEVRLISQDGKELDAETFLDKHTLFNVIPVDGFITGVTVLNSELFVVQSGSKSVNVYNTNNNYTLTRAITIDSSSHLHAIVAIHCTTVCI